MDADKAAEVEMKELAPAEDQDDKDAEKCKMEGTEEAEKKSEDAEAKKMFRSKKNVYSKLKNPTEKIDSRSMPASTPKCDEGQEKEEEKGGNVYSKLKNPPETVTVMTSSTPKRIGQENKEKEDEGEETNVYCKLDTSAENVYMSAISSTPKHKKVNIDVYRKVRLYKVMSGVFMILSLFLLAVVLALVMKLHEVQSSQNCPDLSRSLSGDVQRMKMNQSKSVSQCAECGRGWIKYKNSCYYISKERLSWQESRESCQKRGGDLVVIDNEIEQKFLNKYWGMIYWIGLHYSEEQQWMWIDNTALTQSGSYWCNGEPKADPHGSCALLKGRTSDTGNWLTSSCGVVSQYICQKC